jgi:hypothetical protein
MPLRRRRVEALRCRRSSDEGSKTTVKEMRGFGGSGSEGLNGFGTQN